MPKKFVVVNLVPVAEPFGLECHFEDGALVVDHTTFGDGTQTAIETIFPDWIMEALRQNSLKTN